MQFCQKIHSLGKSLVLPYTLVSLVLDFTQMVLDVGKHLNMAILNILNNLEQPILCNFSKHSLSGEVLALCLHLGVFGAGLHPDGPGCQETSWYGHFEHPEQS